MPDYRTGDILEVTNFLSLSEGNFHQFRGMVVGKAKPNNLRQTMTMHTVIEDTQTTQAIKIFSPLVAKVNVIAYGSNKLRKKLNHVRELDLPYSRITQPLIKGRGFKHRSECNQGRKSARKDKKEEKASDKGKIKEGSMQMDTVNNY